MAHKNSGCAHKTWWFPIVVLVYQRVNQPFRVSPWLDINPAVQDQESPGEPDVRISDPSVACCFFSPEKMGTHRANKGWVWVNYTYYILCIYNADIRYNYTYYIINIVYPIYIYTLFLVLLLVLLYIYYYYLLLLLLLLLLLFILLLF